MLLSISEKRFSHFYNEKVLTFRTFSDIIIKQSEGNHGRKCRNGGIGRRPGLKIPWDFFSYRFDPGFRHHHIAEWSSLAARRAHNPKVMRFKSHLRNQRKEAQPSRLCFFLSLRSALPLTTFVVMCPRSQRDLRENNLQPKWKRLVIVLTTVDTTKQGAERAEDLRRRCYATMRLVR